MSTAPLVLRTAPLAILPAPLLPLLLLAAPACRRAQAPPAPAAPPALAPLLPELEELARRAAVAPDAATQRELREYADIALQRTEAEPHTAARAERALLDHPRVLWALEPELQAGDAAIRGRAALLLGRANDAAAQFPLLLRLKYESDPEALYTACEALYRLGNDSGLAWLAAGMGDERTANAAGLRALDVCREQALPLDEPPSYAALQRAMQDLDARWQRTGIGSRAAAPAVDAAEVTARVAAHLAVAEGAALRPIDEARFVLVHSGRLALPLLTRALGAAEPFLRALAVQVLAQLGPAAKGCAPAVLPLLDDPLTAVDAIRALGELGAAAAAPRLRALLADPDSERRAAAAGALGLVGDAAAAPGLDALLRDPRQPLDVRVQAAFARLCLGDDPAAAAFLAERERLHDYHAPTLARLRERLRASR